MALTANASAPAHEPVLPLARWRSATTLGALLFAAAFLLPAAAHAAGLPVRLLLPMHWPVLLAGLVFGWRGGALVGLSAPGLSFALSGYPLPAVLPAMTVELTTYGLVAGALRERLGWNPFAATAGAILAGRAVFIAVAAATGVAGDAAFSAYLRAALVPGLAAAAAQVALLPLVAGWWVRRESAHN